MATSTKPNVSIRRQKDPAEDPADEATDDHTKLAQRAQRALKKLLLPSSSSEPMPEAERAKLLAALGYKKKHKVSKNARDLHETLTSVFNDQKWNDSNLQTPVDVMNVLLAQEPVLKLQYLLALCGFGSRDSFTILHVVLDPRRYEKQYKLNVGLRVFIRFLLELDPNLPIMTDKKRKTPLLQVLSEDTDREDVEEQPDNNNTAVNQDEDEADYPRGLTLTAKREIVQFFCESKDGQGLGSQAAVESLTMVAEESQLHGIHQAIQSSITIPEDAIERLNPKGDDKKATWLDQKDKYGRTCLHLALMAPFTPEKLWWAKKLSNFRPKLLGIPFEATKSPLSSMVESKREVRSRLLTPLHLLSQQMEEETKRQKAARFPTQHQTSTATVTELPPDFPEIAQTQDLLKHQCLRTFRDEETCKQHMYRGGNEREIFLTLEDEILTAKSLDAKRKHYNLDTMLKRVHIMNTVKINWDSSSLQAIEARKVADSWDCSGNVDFYMIFHWLKESAGVQKVLQVIVEDSGEGKGWRPHSDKAITECLRNLQVEVWAWKRDDIPADVIAASCGEHVKTLYLLCSGRKAVLQSWSGERGLAQLKALQKVHVTLYQGLESVADAHTASQEFVKDLKKTYEQVNGGKKLLDVKCAVNRFKPANQNTNPTNASIQGADGRGNTEHDWLKCMDEFAHFMGYFDKAPQGRQIRVALIDDGVKSAYARLDDNIETGKSWAKRHKPDDHVTGMNWHDQDLYCIRNYESSHTGHGTVMAYYIRRICPNVQLYVAKLNPETGTGSSNQKLSFSLNSAAEAISWAVAKEVDIISMSWAIDLEGNDNTSGATALRHAINNATNNNILMFCANPDKGEGYNENHTYPYQIDSQSIFCIGAATHDGKAWEKIGSKDNSCRFLLPGVQLGIPIESSPFFGFESKNQEKPPDEWEQCSGSSLSCALAAGLAGMILHCALVAGIEPTDSDPASKWAWLKRASGMRNALMSINEEETEGKWLAVRRLFGSIKASEVREATETKKQDMLTKRVVDKFFKEWKSPREAQPNN